MRTKFMLFVAVAVMSATVANYCVCDASQDVNSKIYPTASKQKKAKKADDKRQKQAIDVDKGTVTGIMYADDTPMAVIDGVILREGQSIHNAKVVKINPDYVEFEYEGKRWSQKVNELPSTQCISTTNSPMLPKYPSVEDIVKYASPAVVTIVVYDKTGEKFAFGSGFFIGNGKILTNAHVVEGAYSAKVHSLSKTYKEVTIIKRDDEIDLAVLEVNSIGEQIISLANDSDLRVGQRILAIGNPEGLERTVSDGLISAIRNSDGTQEIQISAPISDGSSGGPLLNIQGSVIGVTYAGYEKGQNLNFAVGIKTLKQFLKTSDNPEQLKEAGSYIFGKVALKWVRNTVIGILAFTIGILALVIGVIFLSRILKRLFRILITSLRSRKIPITVEPAVELYQPVLLSSTKSDRHWRSV